MQTEDLQNEDPHNLSDAWFLNIFRSSSQSNRKLLRAEANGKDHQKAEARGANDF
jgi:hypothetical protein